MFNPLNAVTFAMFARLPALLAEAAELPGIRALVLRGAGTRAFSAGADIGEFAAVRTTPEHAAAYDKAVLRELSRTGPFLRLTSRG